VKAYKKKLVPFSIWDKPDIFLYMSRPKKG
jgi:hypothetical protein